LRSVINHDWENYSCEFNQRNLIKMNNFKLIRFLFLLSLVFGCNPSPNEKEEDKEVSSKSKSPKTIMAIFAHPDDETTIGAVLAKYASLSDVYLVVATDGRYGIADHTGIPAGDSLVAVRNLETECACKELGIHPPHYLGARDGLGLNGNNDFYDEVAQLKEGIANKILELQPSVILTFGPEGDTGHPDHRMIGILTTEILIRENLVDKIDLYYFGWTKEQTKKYPEDWGLGWSPTDLLHTRIGFSIEDEEKALASLQCHKSQFTEQVMKDWIQAEKKDTTNVLYFRKFAVDTLIRDGF